MSWRRVDCVQWCWSQRCRQVGGAGVRRRRCPRAAGWTDSPPSVCLLSKGSCWGFNKFTVPVLPRGPGQSHLAAFASGAFEKVDSPV